MAKWDFTEWPSLWAFEGVATLEGASRVLKEQVRQDEAWRKCEPEQRRFVDLPERVVYVAVMPDGRLAGTVSLASEELRERDAECSPWLQALYVSEDMRGRGIAKMLVNCLLEEVRLASACVRAAPGTTPHVGTARSRRRRRARGCTCGVRRGRLIWSFCTKGLASA